MIHNDCTGDRVRAFQQLRTHPLRAHRSHHHMNHRSGSNNPNGTAGGATSLNGTGSCQFGGSVAGTTGKN
jgi:hypothetical protein